MPTRIVRVDRVLFLTSQGWKSTLFFDVTNMLFMCLNGSVQSLPILCGRLIAELM